MESTVENIVDVTQQVHDTLLQKAIILEQKTEARSKMASAITNLKTMSEGIKQQERQKSPEEKAILRRL